jgi:hypothetical protein
VNRSRAHSAILVVVSLLLIHGCASIYSVVEFEVLEPATVSFPDHVSQLLVVNRAPFTMDVFKKEEREGMKREHLVIVDTLISNNTLRGLQAVLQESPIEQFHHPIWFSERRNDTTAMKDMILTKPEVAELCGKYGADVVISFESYTLDLDEHYDYYSGGMILNHYYEVSNEVKWNIHLPINPTPFDTYRTIDTLYFSDISDGVPVQGNSVTGMIAELFYDSGSKYGKYLVPVWYHTSRTLYKGKGDTLKLASKHTDRGEWEKAYNLWNGLTASSDSTMVSKAYHNMAIFYELEDKLDSASLMVNMALIYDSLELVQSYKEELDIRVINQKEVLDQVY